MKKKKKRQESETLTYKLGLMMRNKKNAVPLFLVLTVILCIVPQVTSLYIQRNLIMIGFYMVLAFSLNFVTGYIGEVSLGHAAFYAIGAFSVALLTTDAGMNYWTAVILSVILCGIFGLVLSFATMRVSGTYLAILTLAFFYLIMNIIQNWESVTHGVVGIYNIPAAGIFGISFSMKNGGYYYCILGYVLLSILITTLLINSRFGRAMKAVREDSMASTMSGINNQTFRTIAYVLAGMLAGLAGTLYAPFCGYINYLTFTYNMCLMILVIIITGGRGTMKGVIIGAIIISPLGEVLRGLISLFDYLPAEYLPDPEQWRFVIYGLIMVIMMRLRPQGILGGKSRLPYKMPNGINRKEEK